MTIQDKKLNNLAHQVLGVLARQPRSGYDIVKQLAHFRPAKTSQVYPTLAKLEVEGLVASEEVTQTARPNKRLFTITEAGNQALLAWIGTEPEVPYYRDDFLSMVYSSWMIKPVSALAMFQTRAGYLEEQIGQTQDMIETLIAEHSEHLNDPSHWRFCRYHLQNRRLMTLQTELVWCSSVMHKLRKASD